MLKIIYSVFIFIHGFAHLVGFFVNWNIIKDKEIQYKTTIFNGKYDIGLLGTKILGIIWLLIGIYFGYLGYLSLSNPSFYLDIVLYLAINSLLLTFISLPDTKFGIIANILLIGFIMLIKSSIILF
jgi:hypothetical protein